MYIVSARISNSISVWSYRTITGQVGKQIHYMTILSSFLTCPITHISCLELDIWVAVALTIIAFGK